jgi:hypothetical protein
MRTPSERAEQRQQVRTAITDIRRAEREKGQADLAATAAAIGDVRQLSSTDYQKAKARLMRAFTRV